VVPSVTLAKQTAAIRLTDFIHPCTVTLLLAVVADPDPEPAAAPVPASG